MVAQLKRYGKNVNTFVSGAGCGMPNYRINVSDLVTRMQEVERQPLDGF
jgi:hypothetical protein